MKLYTAGPMTDRPNFNFPRFFEVEAELAAAGHEVVSPARIDLERGWVLAESNPPAHPDHWTPCLGRAGQPCPAPEWEHRYVTTPEFDYEKALAEDFKLIEGCDGIVLLEDWVTSKGARRELDHAIDHGKRIFLIDYAVDRRHLGLDPEPEFLRKEWPAPDGTLHVEGPLRGGADEPRQLRSPEVHEAIGVMIDLLLAALGDGSEKRMRGEKPSWKVDEHMSHVYSHLGKYSKGEIVDPDSKVHTLAHAACRLLFIAAAESGYAGWMRPAPPDAGLVYPPNPHNREV